VVLNYSVVDNRGGSVPAALTLNLTAEINMPATGITSGILLAGTEDTPYTIFSSDLLAGFTDPNGDTLFVGSLTTDSGTLQDLGNGSWSFTAAENFNGFVKLLYEVLDGQGGRTLSTRDFAQMAVNDAPIGAPTLGLLNGTEDVPFTLSAETLLAGYSDVEGDELALANVTATNAKVVSNGDGTLTVTPDLNFNGRIDLSYQVTDGQVGGSTPASIGLMLSAVDDASVLGSANVTVAETNATLVVSGTLGIFDPDSAAWFVAQPATAGKSGNFTINTNGVWTYTAKLAFDYLSPGENLNDVFQVQSNDGTRTSVAVTIAGTADTSSVRLGDAPAAQSGTGGQWAQAWTQSGYAFVHKADYTNGAEPWSAVRISGVSSQLFTGGDVYAGDVGVSGQSAATSTIRQEIDGKEALRINLPSQADSVTIKLTNLFVNDDGGVFKESGVLRLLNAAGSVVAEKTFSALTSDGKLSLTLGAATGFVAMELISGAYNGSTFVHGAYAAADGAYGVPVAADALGRLHGSDFLLDSVDFALTLVGVPST
jgi:VCBS repeat-containing protein